MDHCAESFYGLPTGSAGSVDQGQDGTRLISESTLPSVRPSYPSHWRARRSTFSHPVCQSFR